MEGCLWWRLFASRERMLQLWTCLSGWRAVVLRKKRRFESLTVHEELCVAFVEDDLPLHALVICMGAGDDASHRLRVEWMRRIVDEDPCACEAMDRHQRIALHYALAQRWDDLDHLSWLVAKSQRMLLRKDAEGRSLLPQAVLHHCPQEVTLLMAVELASRSLESVETLVANRDFESARRLSHRMVEEYFAGVAQFPHAFCRQLLRNPDILMVVDGLQTVWREFVDKWGYYGVPMVHEDLPPLLHVTLDSFVQLTIKAKGEPLVYQWFYQEEMIPGATQPSLFVSQCVQPLHAGSYYCEITNWKGRAVSSTLQLVVVDDKYGPDPSLRFLLSDQDRATLTKDGVVHHITASRGGLVHATLCDQSRIMEGCSLLLPPKCFSSFDANGINVSDSMGMDIVLRPVTIHSEQSIGLGRGDTLMSTIFEVLPSNVPTLVQPAILSIPHSWCAESDTLHELVVIEWVKLENLSLGTSQTASNLATYSQVDRTRILPRPKLSGVVQFEICHFGRFAALARSNPSQNKENEKPLEDVVLCIAHPSRLFSGQKTICCSVWLAVNRPDARAAMHQQINTASAMTTSTIRVQLREGQLLHLRLGRKETISHTWRHGNGHGVHCLRTELVLPSHELTMDPHDAHHGDSNVLIFRRLELYLVTIKPTRYQSSKLRTNSRNSTYRQAQLPEGLVLMEREWRILLPVVHDNPQQPPQPSLHDRRLTQLALAYNEKPGITLFEDLHEMEREFTPYYYQLQIARFTETFWQRYDRTWWFDTTKSEMLLGMYQVAHSGTEPFTVIATDAFAGAIRVVQCSLDAIGSYSEPLLLEPPTQDHIAVKNVQEEENDDDEDHIPSGLRRVLTLTPSLNRSPQYHDAIERLRIVLDVVYGTLSLEHFVALIGVPRELDAVRLHLECLRDRVRAANPEIALLVLAMERLAQCLESRMLLRSRFYRRIWRYLGLLKRLVPEIDCFPNEYNAITIGLHSIVRDLFEMAWARSSPGWFARLLQNEWLDTDLQAVSSRTLQLLHRDAQPLQGVPELIEVLETFNVCEDEGSGLDMELHALWSLREYLLLVVGESTTVSLPSAQNEIAVLLKHFVSNTIIDKMTPEDWEDLVVKELHRVETTHALQFLREHETLTIHLRSVTPTDQERFVGSAIPKHICFRFGIHIVYVDTQHVLKVTNMTLRCGVQGQIDFSREQKSLVFLPALPFDKHTRYQVKLRAQYVHTALGGAFPPTATMTIEFSTGA